MIVVVNAGGSKCTLQWWIVTGEIQVEIHVAAVMLCTCYVWCVQSSDSDDTGISDAADAAVKRKPTNSVKKVIINELITEQLFCFCDVGHWAESSW